MKSLKYQETSYCPWSKMQQYEHHLEIPKRPTSFSPFQSYKHCHAVYEQQSKPTTILENRGGWKQIPMYKSYNKKNDLQNKMIQTTYLKRASYYEHHHYHYAYTRKTNNNSSKRNSNKALNIWSYNHNEHEPSMPMTIQATLATNVMWGPTIAPCSLITSIPLMIQEKTTPLWILKYVVGFIVN